MQLARIEDVHIAENRQRRVFEPDALMELTESIRDRGLLHAPVIRKVGEKIFLVAGERRIKAIKDLWMLSGQLVYNGTVIPEGFIPYVSLGELDKLEAEEAELDENLKRKDLSWQEHAEAVSRLKTLRDSQAASRGETVSVANIAMEVKGRSDGAYQDIIRKEIIVAQHLGDPDIKRAKSADEAFKILKRKEEQKKHAEKAAEVGLTFSSDAHKCLNVDCCLWMAEAEPEQFDVILTDPPYGMGAHEFGDGAGAYTAIDHKTYDDSYSSWQRLMEVWAELSFRVAKPQAHLYTFCDIDNFHELKSMLKLAGWYVFRTPLILMKVGSGRVPLPEHGPRRQYELILYAIKGKKPVTHIYPDIIQCTADPSLGHGAQKPISAYHNLLQRSVRPGDKILDSFAGTGTIFPAAHLHKCDAVGLELSPVNYGICLQRLASLDNLESLLEKEEVKE